MNSLVIAGEKIKLYDFLRNLCHETGYSEEWCDEFWEDLLLNQAVYREFLYWADNDDFLLGCKVGGNTVIDILVWEMRKYNVRTDRGRNGSDCDKKAMVLESFREMLSSYKDGARLECSMENRNGMDQF